jgi:hypothetical protein
MPVSRLSGKELEQLLTAVVTPEQAESVDSLLSNCHEFKTTGSLMPYERYFRKHLGYRDFDLHIPKFVVEKLSVQEADIQFMRPSTFPAPYFNRNRRLMRELRRLLGRLYDGHKIHVERDDRIRKVHYKAILTHVNFDDVLEWVGECTLIDEPHSSGQTPEDLTSIRNDFVIIRFNRGLA